MKWLFQQVSWLPTRPPWMNGKSLKSQVRATHTREIRHFKFTGGDSSASSRTPGTNWWNEDRRKDTKERKKECTHEGIKTLCMCETDVSLFIWLFISRERSKQQSIIICNMVELSLLIVQRQQNWNCFLVWSYLSLFTRLNASKWLLDENRSANYEISDRHTQPRNVLFRYRTRMIFTPLP